MNSAASVSAVPVIPDELVVHAEVVLQGHGRHGLVLRLDFDAFLRLNRLVDAVVVAAARQNTTGVLVNNQDLAVDDHVVLVVGEQLLRLEWSCSGSQ